MIDPDGIQVQQINLPNLIEIKSVPAFDAECYNLEDDKDYEKYIKDVEKVVRRCFEYRRFIAFLRENMDMNKCSFLEGVSNEETFDIKIEIHHYPFSLHDVCEIVFRKRSFYNESLSVFMVAKEAMQLHYKLLIGLIPLSETVHELAHSSRLFIPVDHVIGRYNVFVEYYKPFCEPEQLETLNRIEKYTIENSDKLNSTIIEQNKVHYEIQSDRFALPDFGVVTDNMIHQIEAIKQNNYLLPSANDKPIVETVCPIYFE